DIASDYERMNTLARERSGLSRLIDLAAEYDETARRVVDARELIGESDEEMRALAQAELTEGEAELERLNALIRRELLPRDPRDERNVIVEIRAGAGGDEAAIFAGDLYRMYVRYAERHGWKVEPLSASESE